MKIKPIETHYNGYRFRSRIEARWAVFFDSLGIEYVYEKEGYDLGDAGWYLPDFWLPQVSMWAEVKPTPLTDEELSKCKALVQMTKRACLVLVGETPSNHPYWGISRKQLNYYKDDDDINLTDEECEQLISHQRGILPTDGQYDLEWYCLTNYHEYPTKEHRFYCSPGGQWVGEHPPTDIWWGNECGSSGSDAYHHDTNQAMVAALSARFEHTR